MTRLVPPGIDLREAATEDRERVRAFYVACGHTGLLEPADRVLIAEAGGQIVGAVRLCVEHGVQVLRTMRVRPDAQRRGIGRLLMGRFVTMLATAECFCLPYAHLVGFYGAIGFEPVGPEAPAAAPGRATRRLSRGTAERDRDAAPAVSVPAALRTERLVLRPMSPDEAGAFHRQWNCWSTRSSGATMPAP